MLTKVTAYSQWANVPPLVLNVINRPESDLFEVRNFDGLGDAKADVNTTPKGSIPGGTFIGSNTDVRNLVLTLGLDPDWDTWTISRLRRLLAKYFTPEQSIRFVLETMEFPPVEISGYIESNEPNMFSKDPEHQISIICPDLYFKSVDPIILDGLSHYYPVEFDYNGSIETGFNIIATDAGGAGDSVISIFNLIEDPEYTNPWFEVDALADIILDATKYFEMNSIAGQKYVRSVDVGTGLPVRNLLKDLTPGYKWPTIVPGQNSFRVMGEPSGLNWKLTYFELFGSL